MVEAALNALKSISKAMQIQYQHLKAKPLNVMIAKRSALVIINNTPRAEHDATVSQASLFMSHPSPSDRRCIGAIMPLLFSVEP